MRFVHHFIEFSMPEASISIFIVKLLNNFVWFGFFSFNYCSHGSQLECSCVSYTAAGCPRGSHIFQGHLTAVFAAQDKYYPFSDSFCCESVMVSIVIAVIFVFFIL